MTLRLNREQEEATRTLEGRLLISAGAGSGKTRVLSERAANAVVPGAVEGWDPVAVENLLAITFTDKAAGELAERVRGSLRAAGRQEDARRIDGAWITTIHGMCARILRQSALEAGIDPLFTVLETVESGRLRQRAVEEALERLYQHDAWVRELLVVHSADTVATTVQALGDAVRTRLMSCADFCLETPRHGREVAAEAQSLFSAVMGGAFPRADEEVLTLHRRICDQIVDDLSVVVSADLSSEETATHVLRILGGLTLPRLRKGLDEPREAIKLGRARLLADAASTISVPLSAALLRLTEAYLKRYAELKARVGGLDFDDLQIEAVRLLSSPPGREWLERFELTMVDEFQDTDPLQLRLVEALGRENLCSVGDEQQSIYAFRGADLSVYRAHRSRMKALGANSIELGTNYRSHEHILSFVNHVFGNPNVFGDDLVELRPADPSAPRRLETREPRVEVLIAHRRGNASAESRSRLASAIAGRLAGLRNEGAKPGDIAVLLPTYRHAERYAEALRESGFDVLVVGGRRYFEQPEVHALRSFVRLIANTGDESALGAVLTSEMCAMSDDGLLALRQCADETGASCLWATMGNAPLSSADRVVADALRAAVAAAQVRVSGMALSEVVLRAVEECGYDTLLMSAGASGGQAYANVLKFARLADAFEATGESGASAFSAYLDAKQAFGDHEAPASLVKDGSDAVRIMSIHAAKGLEFPVVVVPELGESGRSYGLAGVWDLASTPRLGVKISARYQEAGTAAQSPMVADIEVGRKSDELAEGRRLLYVACTRAQEVLLLAGACSAKAQPANEAMLGVVLGSLGADACSGKLPEDTRESLPFVACTLLAEATLEAVDEVPEHPTDEQRLAWLNLVLPRREEEAKPIMPAPARLSYSSLKRYEACPMRFHAEQSRGRRARGTQGNALDFGSAFHALLELFGETEPLDDDRIEAIATYHGLDERARRRLVNALRAYRRSKAAHRLAGFDRVAREAPFALRVGVRDDGFVLDGNMDVFATRGREALIVDFKTGARPMCADELKAEYARQADCYALAALKSGYERVEVLFVRPEVDEGDDLQTCVFERTPADAKRIEEDLLGLHRSMRDAAFPAKATSGQDACVECPVAGSGDCDFGS